MSGFCVLSCLSVAVYPLRLFFLTARLLTPTKASRPPPLRRLLYARVHATAAPTPRPLRLDGPLFRATHVHVILNCLAQQRQLLLGAEQVQARLFAGRETTGSSRVAGTLRRSRWM